MKSTMTGENFNRLILAVKEFASRNGARPIHTVIQIRFDATQKKASAYAVDGCRAAKECAMCLECDEDFVALVNAPPIKAKNDALVEIETTPKETYISFSDMRFRTQHPDGEFLDVQKVLTEAMESSEVVRVGVNVDYLLSAIRSIKASGASSRKPVILEFRRPIDAIVIRTDTDNPKLVLPVRIREE